MAGAIRRLPLVLLAALALAACAGPSYVDRGGPEPGLVTRMVEPVVYEIGRQFARTPPSCIAILPFAVAVGEDGAWRRAKEVRRAVYAHLAPLPPRDVELAWIDRVVETMSAAARRNYALLGTLLESRERYLALYSDIVIGAELENPIDPHQDVVVRQHVTS
jgi:hypothetical protein